MAIFSKKLANGKGKFVKLNAPPFLHGGRGGTGSLFVLLNAPPQFVRVIAPPGGAFTFSTGSIFKSGAYNRSREERVWAIYADIKKQPKGCFYLLCHSLNLMQTIKPRVPLTIGNQLI